MQSVDNKHKLIVTLDVVNDVNDQSQLTPMVSETNKILSKNKNRIVLADTGYYNAKEIKECLDDGNILYLKPQKTKVRQEILLIQKITFSIKKKQILIVALKEKNFLIRKIRLKMV